MLRKRNQGATEGFGGFLTDGTEIEGEVHFNEELRVDGKIGGKITSERGRLLVGESGLIEAEINVGTASISGTVSGTLEASVRVEIHSTGKFYGEIHAPALIIEEGAIFEGRCDMGTRVPEAVKLDTSDTKAIAETASAQKRAG